VAERFLVGSTSRTGEIVVLIEPGEMGGDVAFGQAHLLDAPGHELPQSHKGVRGQAGGILVVEGGRGVGVPIFK